MTIGYNEIEDDDYTFYIEDLHPIQLSRFDIVGILPRNPTEATCRPISQHDEVKIYDESQVSQFLVAAKGERNEALFHLAIATGMRQAELLGLKWSDLDWIKNTIRVQRQLRRDFRDDEMFIG